ncbi:MAG: DUF86 domain-containing protein [Vicinamibacterales bacterium]
MASSSSSEEVMLANRELLAASAAARNAAIGAALAADRRVVFAAMAGRAASPDAAQPGTARVAVYVDPEADFEAVRVELAGRLAGQPATRGLDVAVLNTMEWEEAGRLLEGCELLLDRDRAARAEFESRASAACIDFRESEQMFLRERVDRPYGEVVAGKLAALDARIRRLGEFEGVSLEEYVSDWKTAWIVERALEVAIGACIDVTRHTLGQRGLDLPATYRGIMFAARDAGLLEAALAAAMADLCGFRNVLAHQGDRIDAAVVVEVLQHGVRDLRRFREAASGW